MYRYRGFNSFFTSHPIVSILVGINIVFFLLISISIFPNRWFFEQMVGVNILISNGEWWRLVTPIFLHSHFNHLFFNCLSLLIVGSLLEERVKRSTFVLIYLSSGIFANVITYIFASKTYIHAGASGAIFGVLGVFATLIYFKKIHRQLSTSLVVIIILALLFTFTNTQINVYSHIGGFVWGALCGYLIIRKRL